MNISSVVERCRNNHEDWKYTRVDQVEGLLGGKTVPCALPVREGPQEAGRSSDVRGGMPCIVFVNGVFGAEDSRVPEGFLRGSVEEGYTLSLADKTCLITTPVELRFVNLPQDCMAEITTNINIELGESCRLTLIERHLGAGVAHVVETNVSLGVRAKLVHGKIMTQADERGAHLGFTKVTAQEGAYYDNFALIVDGKLTRNEIDVELAGVMAQCGLRGIMVLRGKAHADTTTRIRHAAPECVSRQVYRSVADENARGVFQGKIIVEKDAQKSDGYQLSRALLLSDRAEIDFKPELEINADDVKCSHGSTIGDIDEHALFYLRSRGIGEAEARAILIRAFVDDLVCEIRESKLREMVSSVVEGWLEYGR